MMKLIEADKVKRVMKDYWKAQADKALTLTFTDGNEANKRINSYIEHNHELLKAIDELPPAEPEAISKWKKEFREYVDSLDIARDDWKGIIEYIDELPPVQPDTTTHDSIPAETGKNDGDRTTNDLISRQAVLNATSTTLRITGKENAETVYKYIKKLCDDIKALPPIQPDVIRCKDCKHSRFFDPCFYCYEMGGEIIVPENGFCFKAERKINATD